MNAGRRKQCADRWARRIRALNSALAGRLRRLREQAGKTGRVKGRQYVYQIFEACGKQVPRRAAISKRRCSVREG
eukprot:6773521-Alexandrium_andersonii.AAC.1